MSRTPKKSQTTANMIKPSDIHLIRRLIKNQILDPASNPFCGSHKEYSDVLYLFRRAMEHGESNSALLIGPRGSGKTAVSFT